MGNDFQTFDLMNMTSQTTHGATGPPVTTKDTILETGASATQSFEPIKAICAHLSADVRQCLIYDAPKNPARLIGVEYMITPKLYETFGPEERKLWHSHDYEVRSGMLVMPNPNVPNAVWEVAETE